MQEAGLLFLLSCMQDKAVSVNVVDPNGIVFRKIFSQVRNEDIHALSAEFVHIPPDFL